MEYVIDANVALKWFLPEPHSNKADQLLDGFLHHGLRLSAPDFIVPEVGNTLCKRSGLRGEISISDARASYTDFLLLGLPIEASSNLAESAFNFATQEKHPLYDALYIAMALQRGCEFITSDEALVNKLGVKFPQIRRLAAL